jgi:hypothetical protein
MKLSGIISVGFDVTEQLLIRSFTFVRYWRRNGSTTGQYSNSMRQSGWSLCRFWSQRPSKCLWYSVVTFCQRLLSSMEMAAFVRWRLRSGDRDKKSSMQTVTLRPKQCRVESLAFDGPYAGGWDGYLQQIGYAIASAWSYPDVSPAPGWSW